MSHQSILIVDDNVSTRKLLRLLLEIDGYRVLEAFDAPSAITAVAPGMPSLIVLDIVLPECRGTDLLACFREIPGGATIPIIALTGLSARADEVSELDGFDAILRKPVDPGRLVECVHRLLPRPAPTVERTAARHVLVVDDNPVERKLADLQLRHLGFEVELACDGSEALERARAHRPDAILSDVMMPNVDGFELCHAIRTDGRLADVPVVLISSEYVERADRDLALQAGASDLVTRTSSNEPAIAALRASMDAPRRVHPSALESGYAGALRRQVNRQYALREHTQRELDARQTAITVVHMLSRALGRDRDLMRSLEDALYIVLEHTLGSVGAVYVRVEAPPSWRQAAQVGGDMLVDLATSHPRLLDRCLEPNDTIVLGDDVDGRDALDALALRSGILIPLVARNRRIGAMLLGGNETLEAGTIEIARIVAMHVALAIALGSVSGELTKAQENYRLLMDSASDSIVVIDARGCLVDANAKALDLVGASRDEVIGRHMHEFAAGDGVARAMDESLHSEASPALMDIKRRDGSAVCVETVRVPIEIDGAPHVMMIVRDVTKKRLVADELERSEERYRTLVQSIPDVVWCGTAARTIDVTENVEELTGFTREEMLVDTAEIWMSRIHLDDVSRITTALTRFIEEGEPLDAQYRYQHKNRTWRCFHARGVRKLEMGGVATGCVLVSDITQRRRLEESIIQAQRLESVGMLSGGVAHDFNNILAVVLANCSFLEESFNAGDPRLGDVAEIRRAGERGANLARQLLAFSRRQLLEPTVIDINEIVRDLQKMMRRLIGEDIALDVQPRPGLGQVRADAGQLEQVLMNLVVNARDAIGTSGRIAIATSNATVDTFDAPNGVPPGDYVMLSVRDTGCGMDTATMRQIFEPFFTTKRERGTGLGLSTTYGIVKQSGGHIVVTSKVGYGTTFEVYFPRLDRPVTVARRRPQTGKVQSGSETVLLIEDDDSVRTSVARLLAARGYTVLPTRDGQEALALLASHPEPIHLVLTDLVMPGANGLQVADAIRAHSLSVKVLLMSGFTDHSILQNGELPTGQPFIHKPFSALALSNKIREVLDA